MRTHVALFKYQMHGRLQRLVGKNKDEYEYKINRISRVSFSCRSLTILSLLSYFNYYPIFDTNLTWIINFSRSRMNRIVMLIMSGLSIGFFIPSQNSLFASHPRQPPASLLPHSSCLTPPRQPPASLLPENQISNFSTLHRLGR